MRCFALICLLLTFVSCQTPRDVSYHADGSSSGSAAKERTRIEALMSEQIGASLGKAWQVSVSLAEVPEWDSIGEMWSWPKATVAVAISGSLTDPLPIAEAEIVTAVVDFLTPRMPKQAQPLVAVTRDRPVVAVGTTRTYTVRAGDTLSRIAAAYFGREDAWPSIVAANPDLDPAQLTPGTVLVIPANP